MWNFSKMHSALNHQTIHRSSKYKQVNRVISVFNNKSNVTDTTNLKPWTQIPGPKSYPLIGPLLSFLPGGELHNLGAKLNQTLHSTYGPIVRMDKIFDKKPIIFLYDAESSAHILQGESLTPIRSGLDSIAYYRKNKKDISPDPPIGLVGVHGEEWQRFRSTVNPVLLQPKTIKLYTSVIDEVTLETVERLKSLRDEKNMIVNLDREINLWALESMGVIALGCRLKCVDHYLDRNSPVQQLIEVVHQVMKVNHELDSIINPDLWKYYPTQTFKNAMKYYKKQDELTKYFIDQAIKEFQSNPKSDDQKGVLEKLLNINKEVALVMAADMLGGGIDTVTHSILGALYLLASNPDKQSKLREELKKNESQRPYLKACVKEAFRMMPVTSGNKRQTTKEYSILGYKIPKNINVIFAHKDMSNMDKYFLKPYEFLPERWLVDKEDPLCHKNGHPFAYSPFGFGARSCIGRRIAELEIETFIGRAIENFEIEWIGPAPTIVSVPLNYVRGPYNFVFQDAMK